jgi:HNH endonuclease
MSASRRRRRNLGGVEPEESSEWVRVPAVVNTDGDKVITVTDAQGREQNRLVAELILEAFAGPRPPDHVLRFKDGNRLNCELANLEWAPAPASRPDSLRAKAIATRERADTIRRSLEGRLHSDSALLVSEDRRR